MQSMKFTDWSSFQLNEEISEFNQLRESEMPLVQEIDAKVKELQQKIQSLNNHQMSLKADMRKTKDKIKEMDEKVSFLNNLNQLM